MLTKRSLSLDEARFLAEATCRAAAAAGRPISVSVVDATTFLQVLQRMDGAPLFGAELSTDKARFSMLKMPHHPLEGGLPVLIKGECVGAVGVSGAPPHLDAQFAQAAIDTFMKEVAA